MGVTTGKVIELMCYKINYAIKRMNNNIYVIRPIQGGKDIMVFFDEKTGHITSNTTTIDIPKLFDECCNELMN